jgi:large conductance mechanosensitive channel
MGLVKDFRDFAMRGNVVDLAVGVIIGTAFGNIVNSLVKDILMPPIGKVVGNMDFTNLYVSLSDKVDAANAELLHKVAASQPAVGSSMVGGMMATFNSATRLPLDKAKELGPVIAYGNFITITINFLIVAFCIFLVVKAMSVAQKRFEKEKVVAEAAAPPPDVVLLTEIRDILKQKPAV